jgi:hypothetical protein
MCDDKQNLNEEKGRKEGIFKTLLCHYFCSSLPTEDLHKFLWNLFACIILNCILSTSGINS